MSQEWHTFHVNRTLSPPSKGTKRFNERYGERLVCVRYRDDIEGQRKITTVELVVEERPWHHVSNRIPANRIVSLKVEFGEIAIGKAIRASGGEWYPQEKIWRLAYKEVVALGLTDRIVPDPQKETSGEHG